MLGGASAGMTPRCFGVTWGPCRGCGAVCVRALARRDIRTGTCRCAWSPGGGRRRFGAGRGSGPVSGPAAGHVKNPIDQDFLELTVVPGDFFEILGQEIDRTCLEGVEGNPGAFIGERREH